MKRAVIGDFRADIEGLVEQARLADPWNLLELKVQALGKGRPDVVLLLQETGELLRT